MPRAVDQVGWIGYKRFVKPKRRGQCSRVPLTTLDDLARQVVPSAEGRVELVFVDTEGLDGRVLLGARTLLAQRRLVGPGY